MSRSLVSWRFAAGLIVVAALVCPAPASAADLDVSRFAASPLKVHKFGASPIKDGVLSARVVVLNRGRNSARGARLVLGLSADRNIDPGDIRLDPQLRVTLGRRPLVQVRMAARVPANLPRAVKYAFACVVVPRSTNPEPGPVGVARASGNTGNGTEADCKMAPQVTVEAAWDWSVPARYGHDKDMDGVDDRVEPDDWLRDDAPKIVPESWPVKLKASSSCESDNLQGRFPRWEVDGTVIEGGPNPCEVTYEFPKEGKYKVTLLKVDRDRQVLSENTQTVTVEDVLIVSLGDSIASGEGAPQKSTRGSVWQDSMDCHRSSLAGPALAAKALEDASRKTSVTFVHLACTGATMGTYPDRKDVHGEPVPPRLISEQIDDMAILTRGRKVDSVMLSIGANDIGFGEIAETCFQTVPTCSKKGGKTRKDAEKGIKKLPKRYERLAVALKKAKTGNEALIPEELDPEVLLTEYPDPLRVDEDHTCGTIEYSHLIAGRFKFTAAEAKWASETVLELNQAVRAAARANDWTLVGGIADAFSGHGYCAEEGLRWINTAQDSRREQHDIRGTLHPNAAGHLIGYAEPLTSHLEKVRSWIPERRQPR